GEPLQGVTTFEQSKMRNILIRALNRHYVDMTREQRINLNALSDRLDENDLHFIAELIEIVAHSNYKLGADRQKDALLSNIERYLRDL
ncbi:hypothetical protein D7X33_34865, partial [Butyricicoccus sp. 1XD8-22]